ncbi:MAG: hypothetical protein RLZZ08_1410 [Pseudomonadota bacterium]|jgi:mono/diheme cytochrome c family protein
MKMVMGVLVIIGMAGTAAAVGADTADGQYVFEQKCALCHGTVGTGTMMLARRLGKDHALLAQRTDLQPAYVEAVVRNGIGSMPAITRVELTDAQLAQLARFLARNNPDAAK